MGKKVVPIFEFQSSTGEKLVMPESLDIISKVDSDPTFGPVGLFKPLSKRADWVAWQSKHAELMRELLRSRYLESVLPEFYSLDGKFAFVKNHPMAEYSKVTMPLNHYLKEKCLEFHVLLGSLGPIEQRSTI